MSANGNSSTRTSNSDCKFVRAVEEAFFLLDRDHNRSINSDDLCSVAKSVGIQLESDEALTLIRTAIREQIDDSPHGNSLTADQYSALMLRYVGSSELNDELRQTFNAFDQDRDGRITRQDFDKLRNETSFFDNIDDGQYELVIKELLSEANQNNGIDFNQFVNLMMRQ